MSSPEGHLPTIIEIKEGYKHYGIQNKWHFVLRDINMKVYLNDMCVIIGPFSSGKSTIIKLILGFLKPNQGNVKVFGFDTINAKIRKRIGYHPENPGLFSNLTVEETLLFYGRLLKLEKSYLNKRINFLTNLFELPTDNHSIQYYTMNFQRQLSFAVALLHEPELLLLDDPTTGCDPVLRKNIWNYLRSLVENEGKTILATSCSPIDGDECRRVIFLKNGQIIEEGNLNSLKSIYRVNSIVSLYTKIYELVEEKLKDTISNTSNKPNAPTPSTSEGFLVNDTSSMDNVSEIKPPRKYCFEIWLSFVAFLYSIAPSPYRIAILLFCKYRIHIRSYCISITFLSTPILFILIYWQLSGGDLSSMTLYIVNKEVEHPYTCKNTPIKYGSCEIINSFETDHLITGISHHNSLTEIRKRLKITKKPMGMLLVDKFDYTIKKALRNHSNVEYTFTVHFSKIGYDRSLMIKRIMSMLQKWLYIQKSIKFLDSHDNYLGVKETPRKRMIVMMSLASAYSSAALLVAYNFVSDKDSKRYHRVLMTGTGLNEIIITLYIFYGGVVMLQSYLALIFLNYLANIPCSSSLGSVFTVYLVQIIYGVSLGVFLSYVFRKPMNATFTVAIMLIVSFTTEGIMWPLENYDVWSKILSKASPLRCAALCVHDIWFMGLEFTTANWYNCFLGYTIPISWSLVIIFVVNCAEKFK